MLTAIVFLSGCSGNLQSINNKVNSYQYISENEDYWKTSKEFYSDGGGDCEDFAIAKYDLIDHKEKLILVVYDKPLKQYHAVLLVNNTWILDNQYKTIYKLSGDRFKNRYNLIYKINGTKKNEKDIVL